MYLSKSRCTKDYFCSEHFVNICKSDKFIIKSKTWTTLAAVNTVLIRLIILWDNDKSRVRIPASYRSSCHVAKNNGISTLRLSESYVFIVCDRLDVMEQGKKQPENLSLTLSLSFSFSLSLTHTLTHSTYIYTFE